jgi:hypothetical protein
VPAAVTTATALAHAHLVELPGLVAPTGHGVHEDAPTMLL